MGFFVVLEGEHPLPDVDGKALARAWDVLEPLCEPFGVSSLLAFFSMSEAEQRHYELEEAQLFQEQWFLATEGLRTVRALIASLELRTENTNFLSDLRNFERALLFAESHGVRWHLGIDG